MTGNSESYPPQTCEELERRGFEDPFDPAFIYRSVFGSAIRGHAQTWPDIDFDTLSSLNRETVGWIHMDGTPLDYPVVKQHLYRGYYRTHNFSGEESIHGQIVLDFWHGGSLDGRTIVLHGHRMRDWSMFHVIAEMDGQDYFDAHPTVQFAYPGCIFSARWFAGAFYHLEDPWPETVSFADDAEYRAWLERIAQNNRLSCSITPGTDDRVLVCCTCSQLSGKDEPGGYALFAVIEG